MSNQSDKSKINDNVNTEKFKESSTQMNFARLVSVIEQTHSHLQQQASKAVNLSLTLRN